MLKRMVSQSIASPKPGPLYRELLGIKAHFKLAAGGLWQDSYGPPKAGHRKGMSTVFERARLTQTPFSLCSFLLHPDDR